MNHGSDFSRLLSIQSTLPTQSTPAQPCSNYSVLYAVRCMVHCQDMQSHSHYLRTVYRRNMWLGLLEMSRCSGGYCTCVDQLATIGFQVETSSPRSLCQTVHELTVYAILNAI